MATRKPNAYNAITKGYSSGGLTGPKPPTPAPTPGRVLGANTKSSSIGNFVSGINSMLNAVNQPGYNSGGGGGGGGAVQQAAPQQQSFQNAPQISTPEAPQIDFDALIAPALSALDQAIPGIQQGYQQNVSDINAAKTTQKAALDQSIAGQQQTLGNTKTEQANLSENAADEARRQYSEIQQGLQSRYGGTTGTGAFAAEIAGSQTTRNIGQIRQGLATAMKSIDDKIVQVQEVGRIATQDLEDKTTAQINQAKQQLESSLSQIRSQRAELQSRKAELAANAIQIYQQTVNQVAQANAQFKQQLYAQQTAAEQNLQSAKQNATGIATSIQAQDQGYLAQQTSPVTIDKNGAQVVQATQGQTGQVQSYADQIRKAYLGL